MRCYSKKERPATAFKVIAETTTGKPTRYIVIGPNDYKVEFKGFGARRSANDLALDMNINHLIEKGNK